MFYEEKPPDIRKVACSEDIIANNKKRVCEIYFSGREEENETLGNFIAAKSNLRRDKISMEAVEKFAEARRSASEELSCELTPGCWKKEKVKTNSRICIHINVVRRISKLVRHLGIT